METFLSFYRFHIIIGIKDVPVGTPKSDLLGVLCSYGYAAMAVLHLKISDTFVQAWCFYYQY